MNEKVFALLIAKFTGVRKDGLAQLARSISLQAENEQEATALVEKLTADKVDSFVKDWRKDVDKEVSEGNKTFESTLKKKYDLVEKKEGEQTPPKNDPTDIAATIKAAVAEAVAPFQQKLASYETEGLKKTRLQTLEGKLAGVPESFKAQKLADAQLFITTMDDAAFNEYLTRTDGDITALNQELADKGLSGHAKPILGGKNADGVSSAVASFITAKSDENKPMTGKEI